MDKKPIKYRFATSIDSRWNLFYIQLMTAYTLIIIGVNVITKQGFDLFPLFMIAWLFLSLLLPRLGVTPIRLFSIIFFFLVFDGLIDSLSTGHLFWIGEPWILRWEFGIYGIVPVHPISAVFLFTYWALAIPLRYLIIATYFVSSYYNVDFLARSTRQERVFDRERKKLLLIFTGGIAIMGGTTNDYFNFLVRPQIPDFATYIQPIGFWTLERMLIRTSIMIFVGIIAFTLALQKKEVRLSTVATLLIVSYTLPYILQFSIPFFMGYY